jgi:membrane-associated phospholipid phosphatase
MTPVGTALGGGIALDSRGTGVLEALQEALPAWGLDAFAAMTHLGDAAVLLAVAALIYLAYDRRAGAFVLGVLFAGFAITIAAKAWLAWPRPPAELRYVVESGLGFPSGHAVASTVGWGSMALVLDRVWSARRRVVAAAAVVAVVSLSRVAIGVHYLVDVVAGVAVGLVVLLVAARWLRDEPVALFGLAGGVAALAVVTATASVESIVLLGACTGAVAAWHVVEPRDRPVGRRGVLAAGGGCVVLLAGAALMVPVTALAFAGGALVTAGVLVAPLRRT